MPRSRLSDNINLQAEAIGWINYDDWIKQQTDLWNKAGYTTEEIEQLTKDSLINNIDVGITLEEACESLKEALDKYRIDKNNESNTVNKLSSLDEQQIIIYKELKEVMDKVKQ